MSCNNSGFSGCGRNTCGCGCTAAAEAEAIREREHCCCNREHKEWNWIWLWDPNLIGAAQADAVAALANLNK